MSRSTQFIGLNGRAEEFLEKGQAAKIPSKHHAAGMFPEEKIPLGRWTVKIDRPNWRDQEYIVQEVVQAVPWSSGPMIFTCLELDFGQGKEHTCQICQWVENPHVEGEFDYERGEFWV